MEKNILRQHIMRRVYYTYALSLVLHPAALHGVLIGALSVGLTFFVSIPNVIINILHVEVGQLALYFYTSALTTEVWTLCIIGALTMSALSLRIHIRTAGKRELQTI